MSKDDPIIITDNRGHTTVINEDGSWTDVTEVPMQEPLVIQYVPEHTFYMEASDEVDGDYS